ncbi:MAG: AglZ/HisF2 family acetamidino modification protein [Rikenellaceae bacterium]|nr:AglZ/HisF2 family acetamidino modification protein [Rikenellaceae bacterium]
MLRSRIIPCLLIHNKGLVKTVQFKNPKYVGDPINAVKIFNEKEVDELIVLDIDASKERRCPNFSLIEKLAIECRMPFCYGGGVTSTEEAKKIINLGAEKVALSSAVINDISLASRIGQSVGVQSVVVVLDVVKQGLFKSEYEIVLNNGTQKTGIKVLDFVSNLNKIGVGEIVINSIDKDGTMSGYDTKLARQVRDNCDVPLTILGGAGTLEDVKNLIDEFKIIGAAAGSLFVFKGKYKAVLINYPTPKEKTQLLEH